MFLMRHFSKRTVVWVEVNIAVSMTFVAKISVKKKTPKNNDSTFSVMGRYYRGDVVSMDQAHVHPLQGIKIWYFTEYAKLRLQYYSKN